MTGWKWLREVTENVGTLLLLLGVLVGISLTGVYIFKFGLWPLLTAVIVLIAICLGEGAYRIWRTTEEERDKLSTMGWIGDAPKTPIVSKTFRNERVVLDGFSYSGCDFYNVTVVFKGQKPFDLSHCNFYGYTLLLEGDALNALLLFLKEGCAQSCIASVG